MLERVRGRVRDLWIGNGLLDERVDIRALAPREAIGTPGEGYKLEVGRERMMEATFRGARGQAFSDHFGNFSGTLAEVAAMPLTDNYRRAVFVSSMNATLCALGLCDRTVHCREQGPAECAVKLREHLLAAHPGRRVTLVGLQPKFLNALAGDFELRVLDLDPENIGKTISGVTIEGPDTRQAATAWAELLLVTGSALANGSIFDFVDAGADSPPTPAIVFGVSAAGTAALYGWERFCASSE